LTEDCVEHQEYCSLFGEPNEEEINEWKVSINETTSLITYCSNFTIEELLNCRSFGDHYTSLFTVKETEDCEECVIQYHGQLYQTTVIPDDCEHWGDSEEECGEITSFSTCYNISLDLDAGGTVEIPSKSLTLISGFTGFTMYGSVATKLETSRSFCARRFGATKKVFIFATPKLTLKRKLDILSFL
jgi:hypothetical protein